MYWAVETHQESVTDPTSETPETDDKGVYLIPFLPWILS